MASEALTDFLKRLRGNRAVRGIGEWTDEQLLERFVSCQDESAFDAVVQRHGPMVLGVCRHLLTDAHDVEDSFQATFLVLVSKAASIRTRTLLANWLYRVAYRVALRARANAARRRARETQGVEMAAAEPDAEGIEPELRPILYEELNRLPDKYRVPIVLCYLQGKTNEEAARHLAWPVGTVKGRLTRARELLRSRLTRRGLVLSAGALTTVLSPMTAPAAVPSALLESTVRAAMLVAAGQAAAGIVSSHAAALSRGVLQTMFRTRLTIACAVLLGVGVIGVGTGFFALQKLILPAAQAGASPPQVAKTGEDKAAPKNRDDDTHKAGRRRCVDSLHELMMAMWKYHEVNGHLPPAAIYDKDGKALLSWRVLLLPYLEQDDLFKQFRLNEAWDSQHNKPLLAKMPKQYASPLPGETKEKDATFYQVFVGKGAIFEGAEGMSLSDITDGTSNTIAIVEAAEAVPWTKPADLLYDTKKPLPKLGGLFPNGFHAAIADGSVQWFKKKFDAAQMHSAITRNGGDIVDFDNLKAEK
jgi:RNA polymerase sigma factor (sigma-70 family)